MNKTSPNKIVQDEVLEPRVTDKPDFFDLPEKESYWSTLGYDAIPKTSWYVRIFKRKTIKKALPESELFTYLYYTKEDAEADAVSPKISFWVWNGKPAVQFTLVEVMYNARLLGRKGVIIKSFIKGKWTIIHQYLATEPLRDIREIK